MRLHCYTDCIPASSQDRVKGTLLFSGKFGQENSRVLVERAYAGTSTDSTVAPEPYVLWIRPDEQEFFKFLYNEATSRSTSSIKIAEVICEDARPESVQEGDATNAQEMVAAIASDLSLNTSELARVLHVRRPSIYSWMRGGRIKRVQNIERLSSIYDIALKWRRFSKLPLGDLVRQPSGGSKTIIELLSFASLPRDEILARFAQVAERMKLDAAPLETVPMSIQELRRLRGMSAKGRSSNRTELDAGKRGDSE